MKTKMILSLAAVAALGALAACGPKPAANAATSTESPAAMSDMSGMAGMSDMSGMAMDMDAGVKKGTGVGVITAIDKTANTVTIKHDAIPAVDWPAMTMAFKATPPALLDNLKVGEKVKFYVLVKGSDAEVTAIRQQK
ncbi:MULTISPECIES: copper-binding protein [Asticcacaulis]|uniref:copper-binding protein n=1 Tax=Asticcacaulis TaxID=76890 RepID=UPI001AE75D2E|nr:MULTISPECIES: copper-binding protein [Asticcacaulis]MBP2159023.1 Cu/Ag efflux protein CusF [Asticcacaulis solisilvae]MDR6800068.1 Cu/Ag efflux protein CusF [Asticcacaulis sp. BE141]